jgi:acyl carrier protein
MEIKEFIKKLEVEFEELEKGTLTAETNFRDIDEWSSMHALIIIALIDVEYDVTVGGEDLVKMQTVQDLFNFAENKQK